MKKSKVNKEAHTSNTKYGMGDYYGEAKRNPMGRIRDSLIVSKMSSKKTGKPPKTLA